MQLVPEPQTLKKAMQFKDSYRIGEQFQEASLGQAESGWRTLKLVGSDKTDLTNLSWRANHNMCHI